MDAETEQMIEKTVRGILEKSDMDEMTEFKIRKQASEVLDLDLSKPPYKALVKRVVQSFLEEQNQKEQQQREVEEDENPKLGDAQDQEYDDNGDLVICRLSSKRKVTLQEFRGKSLVSIREFYSKDGKELPTTKGMASDDVDNFLTRLSRKRARDEEENRDKMSIILGTITSVIAIVVAWYNETYLVKEPSRDWDQERRCYLNRLYNGREVDCIEQLRVSKNAFKSLCTILHGKGGLTPTRNVSIEESVAIFLNILAHNLKFRVIGFDYYRSKETISRQFNSVLHAMMRISEEYLKLHPCAIGGSERDKWKWFENCIGALDGTHIPVTVSAEDRPRYRNRKGDISTNVLGVCDPDLKFIYVLSGWEGSASDARVLRDALARDNPFQVPSDKYYLVDAGYANGQGFLAPYRGTRYHLNEWTGNNRPETYKELFNLRHSIARNVIERSFGLLKKRWSILRTPSFFDIKTQIRIINACFVLHNFIRLEQHNDSVLQDQDLGFLASVDHEISNHSTLEGNANRITSVQVTDQWTTFRDTLALQMFHDYQARGTTLS